MTLASQLWKDERGAVVSAELVVISTILVTGLTVGMTCLRDTVVSEFEDVAAAFGSLDQSYYYTGLRGCSWELRGCDAGFHGCDTGFLDCDTGLDGCANRRGWATSWVAGSRFYNRDDACANRFPQADGVPCDLPPDEVGCERTPVPLTEPKQAESAPTT